MTEVEKIIARKERLSDAYEWMRIPDDAEEFTTKDCIKWLNDRPVSAVYAACGDIETLLSRCASLEALVRELAKVGRSAECSLTEAIRDNKAWARDCDTDAVVALRDALSHPIVSELTGEKG